VGSHSASLSKAQHSVLADLRLTDPLKPVWVRRKYGPTIRALNKRGLVLQRQVRIGERAEVWWCITDRGLAALAAKENDRG